jgi:hypothetical protein
MTEIRDVGLNPLGNYQQKSQEEVP